MIANRIIKTELIDWRLIQDLQPTGIKNVLNEEDIKRTILKYGFTKPFYVWESNNKLFTIDGHTRKKVLNTITGIPDMLPATFIKAENRKEAIEILIEVFNQKQNKLNQSALNDLISIDINFDTLNLDVNDPTKEWKGMPEFHQEDLEPVSQIIVSFSSEENRNAFANLIGQKITASTKSIWYPKVEIDEVKHLRYGNS